MPRVQSAPATMTDTQIVAVARQLQRLRFKAYDIIAKLEGEGGQAAKFADDLMSQCFGLAWPEHVVRHYLQTPEGWETGEFGIRRKGKAR